MSGGLPRSHKKCMKSKKWDKYSEICKVCGYRVFRDLHQSKLKSFEKKEAKEDD